MPTPYITPTMLRAYPTGIAWDTLLGGIGGAAEQARMCQRATDSFEQMCGQPLRAGLVTETLDGPDWRVTVRSNGNTRVLLARWPLLSVVSASYAVATGNPLTFTTIPTTAYRLEYGVQDNPLTPIGRTAMANQQALLISPGYVTWLGGRNGVTVQVQYLHGWPHSALTAGAIAGATTLVVDECSAWQIGMSQTPATVYDGANTEQVVVIASSVASGPGTLTLASALASPHPAGVLVSTIPEDVAVACIKLASAYASQRGLTQSVAVGAGAGGRQAVGGIIAQQTQWEKDAAEVASRYRVVVW